MRFFRREDGQLEALRKGNLEGRVDTGQLQGGNLGLKITKVGFYLAIHWLLRRLKAGKILIGNVKLGSLFLGGERSLFIA